jgi:hypothetical protein
VLKRFHGDAVAEADGEALGDAVGDAVGDVVGDAVGGGVGPVVSRGVVVAGKVLGCGSMGSVGVS